MQKLKKVDSYLLPVRRPFNFRLTFWKPSHFSTELERHTATLSWRTFRFGKIICGVRFKMSTDGLIATVFTNSIWSNEIRVKLLTRIKFAYGLNEDITSFLYRARKIPALRKAANRLKGMRMSCPESVFEISIISLLLQNTTISRSTQMMRNLLERYGKIVSFDDVVLKCFFAPKDLCNVTEDDLRRECRLGYRAKYLPAITKFFLDVDDDGLRSLNRQNVLSKLKSIKGIGPYTANIIASHALRDPNAAALDGWNTKIAAKVFLDREDVTANEMCAEIQRIIPGFAGLALLYLTEYNYLDKPVSPITH